MQPSTKLNPQLRTMPITPYQQEVIDLVKENHQYKYVFNEKPESKAYYQKSINQTINTVIDHLETRQTPFSGSSIAEVKERFRKTYIDDSSYGQSLQKTLEELKELYLDDAISFHHNHYVAHLNCPVLIPTLAAEVIISALNTSMDTWDQSAGATFIETKLIDWTLHKIDYPVGSDGVFTSGGTQSNLMGLLLARDHYIRQHLNWDSGMNGLPKEASRFKIFGSEVAHFSLKKNASLLGLGQNAIVAVSVDEYYKMDLSALEHSIQAEIRRGNIPIAVVGTAGTTDFSSIDPLAGIAKIAERYNLWFHVDAAYGGGLILSDVHKEKLQGIERSDSATIDYHKTFFQPVSSSGFFMRNKSHIDFIKYHADYLNPKEQEDDGVPNLVKKSIQTTRRFDALKLWMTLRIMGKKRLGQYIDQIIELAEETSIMLRKDQRFEILNKPEISAIVFRYNPFSHITDIDCCKLNSHIRKAMFNEGKALLASTKVNEVVYLKFTLLNPMTTLDDLREIIEIIHKHGEHYIQKNHADILQTA